MTEHRFGAGWHHRRVWAGDVLHAHTGREQGRGWFYPGGHRLEDGGIPVDRLLRDLAGRRRGGVAVASDGTVYLGSVIRSVRFFGVADFGPTMAKATLEMCGGDATLVLPAIANPPIGAS